jgi:LacI family transcriptional regulator
VARSGALPRETSPCSLAEDFEEQETGEIFARLVPAGRIDGLIVTSMRLSHPLVPLLEERPVPHVFVNRAVPGSGRNVVMDDARAVAIAVDHLVELGHERIAHVAGPIALEPVLRREKAFREQAARYELEHVEVAEGDFLEGGGAEAMGWLLARSPEVTGIFTSTVSQAVGVLNVAWRAGLRVPRDLSIVAHADMRLAEFLVPPLTAVRAPLGELGAAGVDALLEQIRSGATRDVVVTSEPELVLRGSTAPPRATAGPQFRAANRP